MRLFAVAHGVHHLAVGVGRSNAHNACAGAGNRDGLFADAFHGCLFGDDGGHGAADVERTDNEAEVVVVALGAVRCERAALSAAVAAEAGDLGIEVQVRGAAHGQLVGMGCLGEFLLAVRQSRCAHLSVGHEEHTLAAVVGKGAPAHLFTVAHSLGLRQHNVIADALGVQFDELRSLAVVVVIDRAAAVICEVVEILGQLHGIADAGEVCTGLVGRNRALQFDRAVGINRPNLIGGKLKVVFAKGSVLVFLKRVSALRFAVAVGVVHLCGVRSLAFHGEGKLHRAVLALAVRTGHGLVVQVVEAVARPLIHRPVVIVGGGAESVEFRTLAAFNHRLVAVSEVADGAFCLGERHAEAFARHGDAVGGFNGLLQRAAAGVDALRDVGRLDRQLLVHLHIALLGPRLVGFKHKLDFHEIFARCLELGGVEG